MIWGEVLLKIVVSFGVLVSRNKVLLESSNCICTDIDVVVEVIEVQIRVTFDFCLDEESIMFWRGDIMLESTH